MTTLQNKIIYPDGTEVLFAEDCTVRDIIEQLDADCLDTIRLQDGWVMLVDDNGIDLDLPVNPKATELYHSVCKSGTTAQIYGTVAVVQESYFQD